MAQKNNGHFLCPIMMKFSEKLPAGIVCDFEQAIRAITKKCPCEMSRSADFPCNEKRINVSATMRDVKGKRNYHAILDEILDTSWAYTHTRLAKEIGVCKSTIQAWIHGRKAPTQTTIKWLMATLRDIRANRLASFRRPLDPVGKLSERIKWDRKREQRRKRQEGESKIW